ncbi:MAG: HNH endonuclease signature motif containing protein, partial [Acinetobacter sp.]
CRLEGARKATCHCLPTHIRLPFDRGIKMNYQRIYDEFIADRRNKENLPTGYTEKHHITPKSLGGDNSKENLIKLTAQDHHFAHELLAKIYGGAMSHALWRMTTSKKYKHSRLMYQEAREKHSTAIRKKLSGANTGRVKSKDEIDKISTSLKKYFNKNQNPMKGVKKTQEQKDATRAAMLKYYSSNHGSRLGKKSSEETKQKLREYMLSDKNHLKKTPRTSSHNRKIGDAQIGSKNHAYKNQVYIFQHPDRGYFTGTQNNLMHEFNLHKAGVSRLCRAKYKQHKGWVVVESCND